ncbi:hypothetical protein BO71DRAFT_427557 [Aspergillus ellipticus CBS 707.79]|uniref:Uncharacterized protein n=1 Tax=Aspergillus ellipticus CBS 707.79 TaxID=1448320 RepID=A0A319E8B2_9EURO|nr:hypothetical protein BO71DRAFT_427557 [Aspergillus ellipticus CBS 707.79]
MSDSNVDAPSHEAGPSCIANTKYNLELQASVVTKSLRDLSERRHNRFVRDFGTDMEIYLGTKLEVVDWKRREPPAFVKHAFHLAKDGGARLNKSTTIFLLNTLVFHAAAVANKDKESAVDLEKAINFGEWYNHTVQGKKWDIVVHPEAKFELHCARSDVRYVGRADILVEYGKGARDPTDGVTRQVSCCINVTEWDFTLTLPQRWRLVRNMAVLQHSNKAELDHRFNDVFEYPEIWGLLSNGEQFNSPPKTNPSEWKKLELAISKKQASTPGTPPFVDKNRPYLTIELCGCSCGETCPFNSSSIQDAQLAGTV